MSDLTAATIESVLAEHAAFDDGMNLGQYRTEWTCYCGTKFITDGHKGETAREAHHAHQATAIAARLAAPRDQTEADDV